MHFTKSIPISDVESSISTDLLGGSDATVRLRVVVIVCFFDCLWAIRRRFKRVWKSRQQENIKRLCHSGESVNEWQQLLASKVSHVQALHVHVQSDSNFHVNHYHSWQFGVIVASSECLLQWVPLARY